MRYTIAVVVYVLGMVASWLFFSIIGWLLSESMSYGQVLRADDQIGACLLVYSWFPSVFIMIDLDEKKWFK